MALSSAHANWDVPLRLSGSGASFASRSRGCGQLGEQMNICQRFIIAFCLASMAALATFAQDLGESSAKETAINGPSTLAVDNNKAHLFVAEAMGNRVLRI